MAAQDSAGNGRPDQKRRDSGFEAPAPSDARRARSTETLSARTQPPAPRPAASGAAIPVLPPAGNPAAPAGSPAAPTGSVPAYQKQILASAFSSGTPQRQRDAVLGKAGAPPKMADDEPTAVGLDFDGRQPAAGVTSPDLWKAINAPLQSREGRRQADLYRRVIDQFAVGHNGRYAEDAPAKPRAHILVWDVTRAMNAEVPHFAGAKELTLAQTCDWLRHEGPMRGWQRTDAEGAWAAANDGYPTLALPREVRVKLIAVVRPGPLGSDGKPRLSAAALARGNDLSTHEALGVFAVEYFAHP